MLLRWLSLPVDRRMCACCLLLCSGVAGAQEVTATGRVEFENPHKNKRTTSTPDAVVWITPVGAASTVSALDTPRTQTPRLVQKNKQFAPHLLVVPVGTAVEFPNHDPFFHNVFSLFEGKRFDLGLYEAGTTRNVLFDKVGVSYIFCNIHPEMSAVVIALDTPYYGISDSHGEVRIASVPAGRYMLRVWSEASLPDDLRTLVREINLSDTNPSLGTIRISETATRQAHKNKYGQDYEPPAPSDPAYQRP